MLFLCKFSFVCWTTEKLAITDALVGQFKTPLWKWHCNYHENVNSSRRKIKHNQRWYLNLLKIEIIEHILGLNDYSKDLSAYLYRCGSSKSPTRVPVCTDKKRKSKFPNIRKFRTNRLQSHIWLTASSYMVKSFRISSLLGSPSSYMTLQPIPTEFPYIRGRRESILAAGRRVNNPLSHASSQGEIYLWEWRWAQQGAGEACCLAGLMQSAGFPVPGIPENKI